jgi:tetratricopeptide (TPR) repeat protein
VAVDLSRVCFVIMPFGKKPVGKRTVDFNYIYESIFKPAIFSALLPESGTLVPKRADDDFFSGDITVEMFEYIEYSRIALTDISGLNANVLYELGVRHRARESGTAIFRQEAAPLPNFDINHIKAFPYEYSPEKHIPRSKALITQVLTETLARNRLDSPPQLALQAQQRGPRMLKGLLRQAENAIRVGDIGGAIDNYRQAIAVDATNPLLHFRLGLLFKDQGAWPEALTAFVAAAAHDPAYAEAHREVGVAENKLFADVGGAQTPPGEESLRRALALKPTDFDTLASLAGVLKRARRYPEALQLYQDSVVASNGNTYPLLNYLTLKWCLYGPDALTSEDRDWVEAAQPALQAQVSNVPPYNVPWSVFDLAQLRLFLGDEQQFAALVDNGIQLAAAWQLRTFRDNLRLLREGGVRLASLDRVIDKLETAESRVA